MQKNKKFNVSTNYLYEKQWNDFYTALFYRFLNSTIGELGKKKSKLFLQLVRFGLDSKMPNFFIFFGSFLSICQLFENGSLLLVYSSIHFAINTHSIVSWFIFNQQRNFHHFSTYHNSFIYSSIHSSIHSLFIHYIHFFMYFIYSIMYYDYINNSLFAYPLIVLFIDHPFFLIHFLRYSLIHLIIISAIYSFTCLLIHPFRYIPISYS